MSHISRDRQHENEPAGNKPFEFESGQVGRALVELPKRGRELINRLPEPVKLTLQRVTRRSAVITLEICVGLFVVAALVLGLSYWRLSQGPVSLSFLVPVFEKAINRELSGASVKIDNAVLKKADKGAGIYFRLQNIRLVDGKGTVVAQAPNAAIGISTSALFTGRIAAERIDFIGPRLLLFYSPDSGLALTFSQEKNAEAISPPPGNTKVSEHQRKTAQTEKELTPLSRGQIDLVQTIYQTFENARHSNTATTYLTKFGVRDAVVIFGHGKHQSFWRVPDFAIDLEHKQKRSILLGKADILSKQGQWRLNFRTEQSEKRKNITFETMISNLVPKSLADQLPNFPILAALNMPITSKTSLNLSTTGDILGAEIKLQLSAGHIQVPWSPENRMLVDEGLLHLKYEKSENRIAVLPSSLHWGESRATISGEFRPVLDKKGKRSWDFILKADDAVLASEEFGIAPQKVDAWFVQGKMSPDNGYIRIDKFRIEMAGAFTEFRGAILRAPGSPAIKLTGEISAMPIAIFKQMWPRFLAPGAREWIGERVTTGQVERSTFRINLPAGLLPQVEQGADVPASAFQLNLAAKNLHIHYIPGLPPVQVPKTSGKISGRQFGMNFPTGKVVAPSGEVLVLKKGTFAIKDLRKDPGIGEVTFTASSSASGLLELLDHDPLNLLEVMDMKPSSIGGNARTVFRIGIPLLKDVKFRDMSLDGKVRLEKAKTANLFGKVGVQNGTINFGVTEKAIEAQGDISLNGVPAKVTWQRIFGAPPEKQPALRISSTFDESARKQLGVPVNHMLHGEVPTVISLKNSGKGDRAIHIQADLSKAELILANVGWRKPSGHAAILQFNVKNKPNGQTELQNFKIVGDDISIGGRLVLNAQNKLTEYYFPDFSFNVITHMEIAGKRGADDIWNVRVKGKTYDGRQLFRSLFSAGQLSERQKPNPHGNVGINLHAEIDTMVGFSDTTVKNVTADMKKRSGRLALLEVHGKLNGKAPVAVRLDVKRNQPRQLLAETLDAGSAFRLVGFYPSIQDGQASLQVNLDGHGAADKTGTLWARNFYVLGDPIVQEVVAAGPEEEGYSAENSEQRKRGRRRKQVRRQRFLFKQMLVPFSVGHGQFVLHDSFLNGPSMGVTLRGRVDFKRERINLGGTYVPLYALNSAINSLPIIGELLGGRRGEGLLGITFAVQGPMTAPQVVVNPMSMVAPGIFRQIFEMTPSRPQVIPRGTETQPARRRPRRKSRPQKQYDPSQLE